MPATRPDPRDLSPREKQKAHGAQSDQGDRPAATSDAPKPEPTAYEGPEETRQQRREER